MKPNKHHSRYPEEKEKVKLETDTESHISADLCCLSELNQGRGTLKYDVDYEVTGTTSSGCFYATAGKTHSSLTVKISS